MSRRSPYTYTEAKEDYESRIAYQSGKYEGVPLQNNTRLVKREDAYAVKLHNTDVVTYHRDGRIVLAMGGWDTRTTRDRINTYTPRGFRVYRRQGVSYVSGSDDTASKSVFDPGMEITQAGEIITAAGEPKAKAKRRLDRDVREYIRGFVNMIEAGELDAPSAGDCWICQSEEMGTTQHLIEHMEEGYYVPSLLMNALKMRHEASEWTHHSPEQKLANQLEGRYSHQAKSALRYYFKRKKSDLLAYYMEEDGLAVA